MVLGRTCKPGAPTIVVPTWDPTHRRTPPDLKQGVYTPGVPVPFRPLALTLLWRRKGRTDVREARGLQAIPFPTTHIWTLPRLLSIMSGRRSLQPYHIISEPCKPQYFFISSANTWQDSCGAINANLTNIRVSSFAERSHEVPMPSLKNDGSCATSEDVAEPTKSLTVSRTKSPSPFKLLQREQRDALQNQQTK